MHMVAPILKLWKGGCMKNYYNIVFEGKTVPGKEIDLVKKALMNILKADDQGIDLLFSGKRVLIRKNVEAVTAKKFRKAFEDIGAVCNLEQVKVSGEVSAPNQQEGVEMTKADSGKKQSVKPVSAQSVRTADGGEMIITNIETVPGKSIVEHFGLVSGSTIRAKHLGKDLMAGLKNLVGGELKGYTQLLQESRKQAMERLIEQARQFGANAIVNIRFSTSSVAQGAAELYAYGTAVRVE
jgi:uncharacterized protein YbjQ (UPF0145 family)